MSKTRAQQALDIFKELESENSTRSSVLNECARFTAPEQQDLLYISPEASEGMMKTPPVSGEAIRGSQRLINFIVSNTWQQGRTNFTLSSAIEKLNKAEGAAKWFGEAGEAVHQKINSSNFLPKYVEIISSWVRFGQGNQNHRYDRERARLVFRNYATNSATYTITDAEGELAGMAVKMTMTAQAAAGYYNRSSDTLPAELLADMKTDAGSQKMHSFIYVIRERRERVRERKDFKNMKYEALTVHEQSSELVREEGFRSLRWVSPRFSVVTGEKYGRGATHSALFDIREQQTVRYDVRQGAEMAIWPELLLPDLESADQYRRQGRVPGSVGSYDPSGGGKPVEVGVGSQANLAFDYVQGLDKAVRENFFLDLLDVLEGLNAGASATEILERAKRQVNGMLPMVTQLDTEYFEPVIESILEILIDEEELDLPPDALLDEKGRFSFKVSYHNELESKLMMLKNQNLLTFYEQASGVTAVYQNNPALDALIPLQKALRHLAVNNGVSSDVINDEASEKDALKAMQEAAAQARAEEMAGQMVKPVDMQKRSEDGSLAAEM